MKNFVKTMVFFIGVTNCLAMEQYPRLPNRDYNTSHTSNLTYKRKFQSLANKPAPACKRQRLMNKYEHESFIRALTGNNIEKVCSSINTFDIDLNRPLFSTITPLHIVAQKGFFDLVCFLVEKNASCRADKNGQFFTALFYKQTRVVDYLIGKFSIDINKPLDKKDLKTPLHIAFERKCLPLIKILVENHNANLIVFDQYGLSPVAYLAQENPSLKSVHEILDYLYGNEDTSCIDNPLSESGSTLLHEAVKNNNLALIKVLIEKFLANTEMLDYEFNTPLDLARKLRKPLITNYLEEYGV